MPTKAVSTGKTPITPHQLFSAIPRTNIASPARTRMILSVVPMLRCILISSCNRHYLFDLARLIIILASQLPIETKQTHICSLPRVLIGVRFLGFCSTLERMPCGLTWFLPFRNRLTSDRRKRCVAALWSDLRQGFLAISVH